MSEVVSIELLLDAQTDARVRSDWRSLADAGLSSLSAHPAPSNSPHITLLVRPRLDQVSFAAAIARLPVSVSLAEPVFFAHGDRGVLAWRVEPTAELRELHAAVHTVAGPGEDAPHTSGGEWTPHVTLARRLRTEELPRAKDLLGSALAGRAVALRRWDAASRTVTPLR
ncbi:2'-5' RNA ligase family protein [uncultured Microbacterium sp.]|uniref:2'-5' RNA ligase family protein n=1 Tax=uncultured Microbacterium sp. TaxID=191216 RepID=UPI0028D64D1B|nr:2'-5' RNA ligase family protein [uncultured Microbacterium sp.]